MDKFISANDSNYSNTLFVVESKSAMLENGLKLKAISDFSDALIHITLTVNAGLFMQTRDNAGIFELYTGLFFESVKDASSLKNELGMSEITAKCGDSVSTFSFTIPPDSLSGALEFIAEAVCSPVFTDDKLTKMKNTFISALDENQKSLAGFITGVVDTQLNPISPWKTLSGANPAFIQKLKNSQLRSELEAIRNNWYGPENSELTVKGQIDAESFFDKAEYSFSRWKTSANSSKKNCTVDEIVEECINEGRKSFPAGQKFVLVSDNFSSDFMQLIAVYPENKNLNSSAMLMLENNTSSFKENAVSDSSFGIESPYDINISFRKDMGISRLNIQALLSPPFLLNVSKKPMPTLQIKNFLALLEKSCIELNNENDNDSQDNAAESIGEPVLFLVLEKKNYDKYKDDLKKEGYIEITENNAYWFNRKEYSSPVSTNVDSVAGGIQDSEKKEVDGLNFNLTQAEQYKAKNESAFSILTLQNGIPVYSKNQQTMQNDSYVLSENDLTSIIIEFAPKAELNVKLGLFQVVLEIFARTIKNKTGLTVQVKMLPALSSGSKEKNTGTLSFSCPQESVSAYLDAVVDALIYCQFSPAEADEIVYSLKQNRQLKLSDLSERLFSSAIENLFPDSLAAEYVNYSTNIYDKITYNEILSVCTSLLDASNYRVFICGALSDISTIAKPFAKFVRAAGLQTEEVKDKQVQDSEPLDAVRMKKYIKNVVFKNDNEYAFNNLFVEQESIKNKADGSPVIGLLEGIKIRNISVPVNRIFNSISASTEKSKTKKADKKQMPLELKETVVFYDPVQIYFPAPNMDSGDFPVFESFLYELESIIAKKLAVQDIPSQEDGQGNIDARSFLEPSVNSDIIYGSQSYGIISFKNIKSADYAKKIFCESCQQLNGTADIESIKKRSIVRKLAGTSNTIDTVELMYTGMKNAGNCSYYIDWYTTLEKADEKLATELVEKWFKNIRVVAFF